MGLFSLEKLFGITIRESATDGSDFTNPDSDYRRLFLGEDGQLHVKDSAGAVTDIGGAVSEITDIPTADTTTTNVLAPDGAGGVEWRAETGGGGGPFDYATVATDESTTSASYDDLATPGPSVTLTINTKVKVTIGADMYFSSSGGTGVMGVSIAAAAPDDTNSMHMYSDSNGYQMGRVLYFSGLTPGSTVFKAQYYRGAGAGTLHIRYRTILVECMD